MATIKSTLGLNDKMSSTLSSITKAMHSTIAAMQSANKTTGDTGTAFKKATEDISKAEQSLNKYKKELDDVNSKSNAATTSSNSFFKSLLGASLVQKGLSLVNSRLDSAISRYDTLQNYPKVMSNLGIDANEAQLSINRLSEGLSGLPTALDEGALAVQRLTSTNQNIGASTEMFLAMNNAILAGGASSQIQSSAIEQLSQAYSKGKPDMMEWRTLQMAMPAQLKQVATAMGYVDASALGEDLRAGNLSMNDFMKTIVQLNKEGLPGLDNFETQARNATGGIATSIANMKTAVTKGITNMIEETNSKLKESGLPDLPTMISNTGKTIQKVLSSAGTILAQIIAILSPIYNWIVQIYQFMSDNWSWVGPIIYGIVTALILYKTYTTISTTATKLFSEALTGVNIKMLLIIAVIAAIVAVLIYFWNTNDEVAYWMIYAWDMLRLGAMALWLGVKLAFYSIVLAGLSMWEGILDIVLGIEQAFYAFKMAGLTLEYGFNSVAEGVVNAFIWMYNKVAEILNKFGGKFESMNYADFTSKTIESMNDTVDAYIEDTLKLYDAVQDTQAKKSDILSKMKDTAINDATNIQNKVSEYESTRQDRTENRNKLNAGTLGSSLKNAMSGALMDLNLDDLAGTDTTGSKALKTTTNDSLISDEDIQLLLDVATRDYKLNYQQVTPNITLTFGDIRETADVDDVLDEIANRLEEIYDGDLEVE